MMIQWLAEVEQVDTLRGKLFRSCGGNIAFQSNTIKISSMPGIAANLPNSKSIVLDDESTR